MDEPHNILGTDTASSMTQNKHKSSQPNSNLPDWLRKYCPKRVLFLAHAFFDSVVTVCLKVEVTWIKGGKMFTVRPFTEKRGGELPLFDLEGLLPVDQRLSV